MYGVQGHGFDATVSHVIDGDTVILEQGEKVRLIGINAPELGRDGRPSEPYAEAARRYLEKLVLGKTVTVTQGGEERDRYGRTLGTLTLPSGLDVQDALIKSGMSVTVAISPNTDHVPAYLDSEATARAQRLGIWSESPAFVFSTPGNRRRGFQIAEVTLTGMRETRANVYLDGEEFFSIQVPIRHWKAFSFARKLRDLDSPSIQARGWVVQRDRGYVMIVSHPSMLQAGDQ